MGLAQLFMPQKPLPELQRMSLEDLIREANRFGGVVRLWQHSGSLFNPEPIDSWDAHVVLRIKGSEFDIKKHSSNPSEALAYAIDEARRVKEAVS